MFILLFAACSSSEPDDKPDNTTPVAETPSDPDTDADRLSDRLEPSFGTDIENADTDGDGFSDGAEVWDYGTSPVSADTDEDGLTDRDEVLDVGSDPLLVDTDDDGLSDGEEVASGSSPLNNEDDEDDDNDGWLDTEEAEAGTDPLDRFDWPFGTDRWPDFSALAEADGVEGSSWRIGEVIPDFTMIDQFGNNVSLYQFYGYTIVLDFSASWCGPCQDAAPGMQELWEKYRSEGVMIITILEENVYGNITSTDNLAEWADAFGLELPVLGGQTAADMFQAGCDAGVLTGSIPDYLLIDADLRLDTAFDNVEAYIEPRLQELGFEGSEE